jgi:hypothetical protein
MEIGDLIYVILLLLFMILGFFNDSRKKKEQQKQQQEPNPNFNPKSREITKSIPPILSEDQRKKFELEKEKRLTQINREKPKRVNEGEFVFKSSMDLMTDFKKESSLGSSIYINDTGTLYDMEPEAPGTHYTDFDTPEIPEVPGDSKYGTHPLVEDLLGVNRRREFVKGLIYSEILKRKY